MSRFSDHELDDIKARNPLADVAGGYVKLRRAGGRLVGPCPICGGRVTSQRFEILDNGESWVCAVCPDGGDVIRLVEKVEGCDFLRAIEKLGGSREMGFTDPAEARRVFEEREKKRIEREKTADGFREAERKRLFRAWKKRLPVHGTPVEAYAVGRGLQLPAACPGLGCLPSAPYWHGEKVDSRGRKSPVMIHSGPAMLAAFIRGDGKFGGLHTTWLTKDEVPAKAEIVDPASGEVLNSKKMRGSKTGAHIAIAMTEAPPRRLIIGEGIETVLSVWTAHHLAGREISDTAFWAAGDLGNMAGRAIETIKHPTLKRPNGHPQRVPGPMPDPDDAGLPIPASVEELILLGDGDSEPLLTQCAMERAARRYAKVDRIIRIAFAPAGMDFNDVLRSQEA
jgi:CHC2 zinc finger